MRVFDPTLIRTADSLQIAGGGTTVEMDFSFGNLEGAKLLAVEYMSDGFKLSATGALEYGLNFNPSAPAPAVAESIAIDEDVVAAGIQDNQLAGAAFLSQVGPDRVDMSTWDIVIVRNLGLQVFTVGVTAGVIARVYYKRVIFDQNEIGAFIAFRR